MHRPRRPLPSRTAAILPGYPEVEDDVEPPDDMPGQLCADPLAVLLADVVADSVVVVEFVWAEANPTEATPTTAATSARAMRE